MAEAFPGPLRALARGIRRSVRGHWLALGVTFAVVLALDVLLPPIVLSLARKPWTFFTFNPWLKRAPEYLLSSTPWTDKLDFLSRVALFWFSADGPYGQPEWAFAVDGADVLRFVITALLIGIYVALWLEYRTAGAGRGLRTAVGKSGGTLAAVGGVLGFSTGPCSVAGCGAPVLPVLGLAFAGLSSTTLAVLSQISRISAAAVIVALLGAIIWLGVRTGARMQPA